MSRTPGDEIARTRKMYIIDETVTLTRGENVQHVKDDTHAYKKAAHENTHKMMITLPAETCLYNLEQMSIQAPQIQYPEGFAAHQK